MKIRYNYAENKGPFGFGIKNIKKTAKFCGFHLIFLLFIPQQFGAHHHTGLCKHLSYYLATYIVQYPAIQLV